MEEIKAGDTVRVKSGGPNMTVSSVEDHLGEMSAICHWFDGKRPANGRFPVSVLVRIDPTVDIGGFYVAGTRRG